MLTPLGQGRGGSVAPIDITTLPSFFEAYDLTSAATRWQDAGRTTPATTTADPVAVLDSLSGVSTRRLTNPNTSVRPLVGSSGIVFDGADTNSDYLRAASWGGSTTFTDCTVFWRSSLNATNRGSSKRWWSIAGTFTDFGSGLVVTAPVNGNHLSVYRQGQEKTLISPTIDTAMHDYVMVISGTTLYFYVDGALSSTQSFSGSATLPTDVFALAQYQNPAATDLGAPIEMSRWGICFVELSAPQRETARRWLNGG